MVHICFDDTCFEIGSVNFLKSFFSTVFVRLEKGICWGDYFPIIMNNFYQGKVSAEQLNTAVDEIKQIREKLKNFTPEEIVWDFENRTLIPPWKTNISPAITSLSNYFVTSDGKDLLDLFLQVFSEAKIKNKDVFIE